MKRIDMTVDFKSEVAAVFKVITNLKDCSWRSDLTRVEQIGDNRFIEYDRKQRETKILLQIYVKIFNLTMMLKIIVIVVIGADNLPLCLMVDVACI